MLVPALIVVVAMPDLRGRGVARGRHPGNPRGTKKKAPFPAPLAKLAEWTGLEPATSGVTGQHSNRLNYHSAF